jgi:hypothetical protein
MPRLDEWNLAIAKVLTNDGSRESPVFLDISIEHLQRLGIEWTTDNLVSVVKQRYVTGERLDAALIRADSGWRGPHRASPPYLALLAVCVLAAADMARDDTRNWRVNNYYGRLRERLEIGGQGVPLNFDLLDALWEDLRRWLDESGVNSASITTHPNFPHVGYPVSQAVFPARDRNLLPEFFTEAELAPSDRISDEELLVLLRSWNRLRGAMRATTRDRINDEVWGSRIAGLVSAALKAWDGLLRDPTTGLRRLEVRINAFQRNSWRIVDLCLRGMRPVDVPREIICVDGLVLTVDPEIDSIFNGITVIDVAEALEYGGRWVAESDHCVFSLEARKVIPFHPDFELGGWWSCRRIQLHDDLFILAHQSVANDVASYLRELGLTPTRRDQGLPNGWVGFSEVRIHTTAAPHGTSDEILAILPHLTSRLRLEGGLKIDSRAYLSGDGPIARIELESATEARLDEKAIQLQSGSVELALQDLDIGVHKIQVGPASRSFVVVPDSFQALTKNRLGFPIELTRHDARLRAEEPEEAPLNTSRSRVWITGASVIEHEDDRGIRPAPTLLIRRSAHSVFLVGSARGEAIRIESDRRRPWLSRIDQTVGTQFFEARCSFQPRAVVKELDGVVTVEEISGAYEVSGEWIRDEPLWSELVVLLAAEGSAVRGSWDRAAWATIVYENGLAREKL